MKTFILYSFIFILVTIMGCQVNESRKDASMKEPSLTARVDSVMNLMTIDEKIGQLVLYTSHWDQTGPRMDNNYLDYVKEGKVGAIFNAYTAQYTRQIQEVAVKQTRLGIPLIFGYDVIHGHRTIFPISLGEAASWDLDAIENASRIAAIEASAEGIHWTFAPMVDISRDPRWGRVSEGSGEDVFLGSLIARARVHGFQGDDLSAVNTILACAKHFAAYGAPQAGRDYNTVDMSARELMTNYLPPYKAAMEEGVATFMTSFNELDGIPSSGNGYLLNEILRNQWGFEGFVVTDYTSINEMVNHGFASDEKHAGELAINAGVDMDMQGGIFSNHLKKLLEENKVSQQTIDNAVRRILTLKFKLGLFDDPYRYCDVKREKEMIYNAAHLEAAKEMACKSIVLLKNENQTLPLKKSSHIALVGPLANDKYNIIGSWSAAGDRKEKPISVLEGLEKSGFENIEYVKGCEILDQSHEGFSPAITAALRADVIVAVMGEAADMSGEAASRTNLDLPGEQKELLKALKATGKPIILVLINGRPLTIEWESLNINAIIEAWFPGTMGGLAIAEVLAGDYNPAGKLPMTFPRNVGQIPIFYNHKNTGRPINNNNPFEKYRSNYLDAPNSPLYPFGYGLSYTTFEYSDIKLSADSLKIDGSLTAEVIVSNTGRFDGEEVVQLYLRDLVGSVTRPVKELKGFKKVNIPKGQSVIVSFKITADDLKFYDAQMNFTAEPGNFELFIGGNSDTENKKNFRLND